MAGAVHISMIIIGRIILGLGVGVGTTVRPQDLPMHAEGARDGQEPFFASMTTIGPHEHECGQIQHL